MTAKACCIWNPGTCRHRLRLSRNQPQSVLWPGVFSNSIISVFPLSPSLSFSLSNPRLQVIISGASLRQIPFRPQFQCNAVYVSSSHLIYFFFARKSFLFLAYRRLRRAALVRQVAG
eukprot:EG_transcript_41244